jgi:quercetin 2,3-dioxygenase
MIKVRKSDERGFFDRGWLKTYHTFSFAEFHDPQHMGFRSLRVINEDWVAPGTGFPTHSHRDMEIITYVLEGEVEHRDSLGNSGIIRPGEIQRMSAGTGVTHSEFNPSKTKPLHLLQIWIFPDQKNRIPGYEQKKITENENGWSLIASAEKSRDAVLIHQRAKIWKGRLKPGQSLSYELEEEKGAWIHVIEGSLLLNGCALSISDSAGFIKNTENIHIEAETNSQFLLFDLD